MDSLRTSGNEIEECLVLEQIVMAACLQLLPTYHSNYSLYNEHVCVALTFKGRHSHPHRIFTSPTYARMRLKHSTFFGVPLIYVVRLHQKD